MQKRAESELVECLRERVFESVRDWPPYERQASFDQTTKLGEGFDCNYDRPTVGIAYSLWYMPRRIQDAIRALLPCMCRDPRQTVTILDLGCGTGATWWACRYLMIAARNAGVEIPRVRVVGCDTSPSMLALAQEMWASISSKEDLPLEIESHLSSWTNVPDVPHGTVIFASYLLDQSDSSRIEELGRMLRRIADTCMSRDVLIVGANNKRHVTNAGVSAFLGDRMDWNPHPSEVIDHFWTGAIPDMRELRREFAKDCSGNAASYSFSKVPSWSPDNPDFNVLRRSEYETLIPVNQGTTFIMDDLQNAAATPDNRLTAILGAAGSGKSRVLVERLVRTIHAERKRMNSQDYLVTCFNKEVVKQLRTWFLERCKADVHLAQMISDDLGGETVLIDKRIKVKFLTWDTVVKRSFDLPTDNPSSESEAAMKAIIDKWVKGGPGRAEWLKSNSWATPQFILQEMKRVVYGQGVTTLENYLRVKRHRRPSSPQMNESRRREIWGIIDDPKRTRLWIDRRILAHKELQKGANPETYDRVFLDECQDFVIADFDLLNSLVPDPNRIVVCGDGTQALQTGSGYSRPRTVGNRRWVTHELNGSYRLPVRICEAIEPIARWIRTEHSEVTDSVTDESDLDDVTLPESVKSAVIGCRPILMACDDLFEFTEQLSLILRFVAPLVKQHDSLLITNANELNAIASRGIKEAIVRSKLPYRFEPNSMLRIKGLERPCVFFSTHFEMNTAPGASPDEWIYTILTRPTSVLIILLSARTDQSVKRLIGMMRKDCLLFWDKAAEDRFMEFSKQSQVAGEDPF